MQVQSLDLQTMKMIEGESTLNVLLRFSSIALDDDIYVIATIYEESMLVKK